MADTNEVFRGLEDSTGEGTAHIAKKPGDAQTPGTDHQAPVVACVDSGGLMQNIEQRDAGQAVAGVGGLPTFAFQDDSNNFVLPTLNADGSISVSVGATGTIKQDIGNSVGGNTGSRVQVAALTLVNSKTYTNIVGSASCTKACKWELEFDDNGTLTVIETLISGPGHFSVDFEAGWQFSSGGTGTQVLRIYGTQLRGPNTDLYASVQVNEN